MEEKNLVKRKMIKFAPEIYSAFQEGHPIVALESAVISHGLPYPENLKLAQQIETIIRRGGAIPATIGVIAGQVKVGLSQSDLGILAEGENLRKVSVRDFAMVMMKGESGGTTVAGTLAVCVQGGIRVFATGGIGGVHRDAPFDISADLPQLARSPVVVVCAGAKSILDLPATLEQLETRGIPVIGYQTDEFPAFYSRRSGLPVSARVDSPKEAAEMAESHWAFGFGGALLVVVPPPKEVAIPYEVVEANIQRALEEAAEKGIRGQAVTPFLLNRMNELTSGDSLKANLALLKNNAEVAAHIAQHLYTPKNQRQI